MNSGVYQIQNIVNGKIYVGSTMSFKRRWSRHQSRLAVNKHHSPHLQNAWNKYGPEAFVFSVLLECSDAARILLHEQSAIDVLHPEYNVSLTARASMRGRTHSIDTKVRMSKAHLGKVMSTDAVANMSKAQSGKVRSTEARAKISASLRGNTYALGCKHSTETKAKVSSGVINAWITRRAKLAKLASVVE